VCAVINMLVSVTFSWTELVFDYLAGCVMGYFLWLIVANQAGHVDNLFFVLSHGLFALFYLLSDALQHELSNPLRMILVFAGLRIGATLWSAALDHGAVALGAERAWAPVLFSFLVAPAKLMFSTATTAVGILIWLTALLMSPFTSARAGFAGGVLYTEFKPERAGYSAVTVGATVHTWHGKLPFKHELYHTRQYIYLSDWLIPFWLLGTVWGVLSKLLTTDRDEEYLTVTQYAYAADGEKGNPLEVAAYRLG